MASAPINKKTRAKDVKKKKNTYLCTYKQLPQMALKLAF